MNKIVPDSGYVVKCMWCTSHTNDSKVYHPDHCAPYAAVVTGAYEVDQMSCNPVRKSHHADGQYLVSSSNAGGRHLLGLQSVNGLSLEDPYGSKMGGMMGGKMGGMMGGKMGGMMGGMGGMMGGKMGGMMGGNMGGNQGKMGGNMGGNQGKMGGHTGAAGGHTGSAHTGTAAPACKNANASNPLSCQNEAVQFLGGLAFGTVGLDPANVIKCGADLTPLVTELKTTFQGFHLSVTGIAATITTIKDTVNGVKTAINDCNLGKLKQSLTSFVDHFEGVIKAGLTAGTILAHGVELYDMVDDAVHASESGNLYEVGLDVGKVINVIIGNE